MSNEIRESIEKIINSLGGAATLAEICSSVNANTPWEREAVFTLCQRHFDRVSVAEIGREYFTKNTGRTKWAYKIKTVSL